MKAKFKILKVTSKGHFSIEVVTESGIAGVTTVEYAVWLVQAQNPESFVGKTFEANVEFGKGEVKTAAVTGAKEIVEPKPALDIDLTNV